MHLPRSLLCASFLLLTASLTFYSLLPSRGQIPAASSENVEGSLQAFFSFNIPSALFPPSAIISLTDDNSTFFLSRPAEYGPPLPYNGQSGRLWIGSGFGESSLSNSHLEIEAEGELGCSDIPGWSERHKDRKVGTSGSVAGSFKEATNAEGLSTKQGYPENKIDTARYADGSYSSQDDGTDDYLHYPYQGVPLEKGKGKGKGKMQEAHSKDNRLEHADIRVLQESAEVAGKVVLLSRGGCGFLEKTKWVQRRGGIALIVGNHLQETQLLAMYARGDVSNITIPSLFTSRTTAHLLSSLMPSNKRPNSPQPIGGNAKPKKAFSKIDGGDRGARHEGIQKRSSLQMKAESAEKSGVSRPGQKILDGNRSWLSSLSSMMFPKDKGVTKRSDRSRPPGSGRNSWAESQGWDDDSISTSALTPSKPSKGEDSHTEDFVIGVQDWRDPDMVAPTTTKAPNNKTRSSTKTSFSASHSTGTINKSTKDSDRSLSGGSRAPESGIYQGTGDDPDEIADRHEGLWVTMTPASMSTAPFFDTLLVLVVSPLVTLTIVYALLILRSRIRRRRWRAPKSVVEQLPVRTYHTMSCSSSSTTSQNPSPDTSSPSSPLLQNEVRCNHAIDRPEPRTASVLSHQASLSPDRDSHQSYSPPNKRHLPRRYKGKQIECVVCLEEYVDGQSQVMSLPCGHEFHADCITPWLTIRRRTCPICKGDVVRYLKNEEASNSFSSSQRRRLQDDPSSVEMQSELAITRNDNPSASIPIPHNIEGGQDAGDDAAETLVNDQDATGAVRGGWRDLAARSLAALSGSTERSWRHSEGDRR